VLNQKRNVPFGLVILIAAFVAVFAASLSLASAKSHAGDVTVWFANKTIGDGDEVHGDLDIVFGTARCESGGIIDGNVRNYGGTFEQLDGCQVNGRVVDAFGSGAVDNYIPALAPFTSDDFIEQNNRVLKKLAWDVVVIFAFLLFPLRVRVALDRVELHPGLSFATGIVAVVAAIPVAILLLLSIVGLPIIPLEIAALFAGLWIGNAAVALLIGRRLYELLRPHATPSPLGALALGLIVITAAEMLPVVGWAVSALVVFVGLGAALLAFVRETSFRAFTGSISPQPVAASTGNAPPPPPGPPMNRPA
jgi:hypothetical protein